MLVAFVIVAVTTALVVKQLGADQTISVTPFEVLATPSVPTLAP